MLPKITFGIIVLNGEPFTRYCLRSIYQFAHEIIVVEGAVPASKCTATPDGHSKDGTLQTLSDFKLNEDPDNKLKIVTAEGEGHPNGFWPGEKDEMSKVYAKLASGDFLWQVDVDEFYKAQDIAVILKMLHSDPEIMAVSFKTITFWGGFDYITDGLFLRRGDEVFHRLFRWGEGFKYETHRPPTVYNAEGRNLRSLKWIDGYEMARQGIFLYHYSLLLPKQVTEKCEYYASAKWAKRPDSNKWRQEVFIRLKNPYRIHNVYSFPSWLDRFSGSHPDQIEALKAELLSGQSVSNMRSAEDIEVILNSRIYRMGCIALKLLGYCDGILRFLRYRFRRLYQDPIGVATIVKYKLQRFSAKR